MKEPYEYGRVVCVAETTDAIKVLNDEEKEFWLPKSALHDDSEVYAMDHDGLLVVHEWLAVRRGWC